MPAILAPIPPAPIEPEPLDPSRRWMSAVDLGAMFRVREYTIRDWAKKGLLPPGHRFGKRLRWRLDQVEAHLGLRG
jgi:hypothetical protein